MLDDLLEPDVLDGPDAFPLIALSLQLGQTGRFMTCANDAEPSSPRWAFMLPMVTADGPSQSLPVRFSSDPTAGPATLIMNSLMAAGGDPLYLTFSSTEAQGDLFWWTNEESQATPIQAIFTTSGYQLSYASASGTNFLISTSSDDTWFIYGGPQGFSSFFVPQPYFVTADILANALIKLWPAFTHAHVLTMHPISGQYFQPIYQSKAKAIQAAAHYQAYSAANFDCEDFALVLKAQASVQAATAHESHGYAFALLTGTKPGEDSHALCLFWGPSLVPYLIEPQNGDITYPEDWDYSPSFLLL